MSVQCARLVRPRGGISGKRNWGWAFLVASLSLGQAYATDDDGPAPEVQVTRYPIIDYEFDWGRDGVDCPTCNHGAGNSRLAFTDNNYNLWVGSVDFNTGDFSPTSGKGVLIDTQTALSKEYGNGPEWMFSVHGSQLVYTRYAPDVPQSADSAEIAVATQTDSGWQAAILPGTLYRVSPIGSTDLDDTNPQVNYQEASFAANYTYWRSPVAEASVEGQVPLSGSSGGSRRWIPGTKKLLVTADDSNGSGHKQVYLYDTVTGKTRQLTNDTVGNSGAFMWRAPEFKDEFVMFTVRNSGTELAFWRKRDDGSGKKRWTIIWTLPMPAETPKCWSPEPFIHNGHSYIFFQMNEGDALDYSIPNVLAMTAVSNKKVGIVNLTPAGAEPKVRTDPEYFITAQGPYIYYNRYALGTDTTSAKSEGVWRVDTKLGPPKAATVASLKARSKPVRDDEL